MLPIKTVYYTDEQNDEFSTAKITPKYIDDTWNYLPNGYFWKVKRFFLYRLLAHPIGWIYLKTKFGWRVKNRRVLKKIPKRQGCFLYGNHTQAVADAFVPSLAVFPRPVYTIVHANNVSMPVLGKLNAYMGALPVPDNLKSARNFYAAVRTRYGEGSGVMIYPEAHIWPYFIGIRSFPATSFRYPVTLGAPCFVLTNTYQRRRRGKKPKLITYLDGPFYPDTDLHPKAAAQKLRNQAYQTMRRRCNYSNCESIRYLKAKQHEENEK
jgi:1-acyl-sn-glycerol-3-phosphate acyltransferase